MIDSESSAVDEGNAGAVIVVGECTGICAFRVIGRDVAFNGCIESEVGTGGIEVELFDADEADGAGAGFGYGLGSEENG